ncbi:MAG: nucleoside monophosphate kinase [Spirochaetaceae bacterium]|nr:nucleoside monophosphate kinase [Myxococcales bacterium]MCB9722541.1 nucleoside monophosphate kinase [Spirochaetaceae bacterium]
MIRVEKIALRGPGVVILTGPSSCGKGEVANALCDLLSIDARRHLSMGAILRSTIERSKSDPDFMRLLEEKYALSRETSIFDCVDTTDELTQKVRRHLPGLERFFGRTPSRFISEELSGTPEVSQLEWLEFCTARGLLIPNRWTQDLISAEIERTLASVDDEGDSPFILDGYPRTVAAARHLLSFLRSVEVPVLKVLHLSISKAEMTARAGKRGRFDDDEEALRSRFDFYVENVQPSVDYLKTELGGDRVALIDAHQPAFVQVDGERVFHLQRSIENVVSTALRALGVPRVIVRDLLERRREERAE